MKSLLHDVALIIIKLSIHFKKCKRFVDVSKTTTAVAPKRQAFFYFPTMSRFENSSTVVNLKGDLTLHIEKYLATGSLGAVFQASLYHGAREQTRAVAAKFVHLPDCTTLQTTAVELQQSFLKVSSLHKSLLRCDVFADEQLKGLWIVSDLCYPGNTLLLSKTFGGFTESQIACFVEQVLAVLVSLEEKPSWQGLHCIKGSNILLDRDGLVKVVDYVQHPSIMHLLDNRMNIQRSVVYWSSPESINNQLSTNCSSDDIWALGVWMIELAQGYTPFHSYGPCKVASCLQAGERPQLECPSRYSIHFLDFLHQCLQKNPQLRPSARELLAHPFLSAARKEDISHILQHTLSQDQSNEMRDLYLNKEWIVILSGNKFVPLPYLSVFDVAVEQTKLSHGYE